MDVHPESAPRPTPRTAQEAWEELLRSPEAQRYRREIERTLHHYRWYGVPPELRPHLAGPMGAESGGRPPRERRCTKRLGTRLCWGWREPGTDRCRLHPRGR